MSDPMGHQSQLAINDDGTAIGSFTQGFEFVSETLKKQQAVFDTNGIRGTRSHQSERTRFDTSFVSGDIVLHPSPADLDILLPYIMGVAESADTFALGESLASFEMAIAVDRITNRFVYDDCKVNRATFRASPGGLVELALNIIGRSETVTATAYPSITLGTAANDAPYVHSDLGTGLTLQATGSREVEDWEIVIDNVLVPRWGGSETPDQINETDRIITFNCTVPYSSANSDLYDQALAGAAGTLVLTNGNMSTTFTFATLQLPKDSPTVASKERIPLTLNMTARKLTSTMELEITHDSTA